MARALNKDLLKRLRSSLATELRERTEDLERRLRELERDGEVERVQGVGDLAEIVHTIKGAVMILGGGPLFDTVRGLELILLRAQEAARWLSAEELSRVTTLRERLAEAAVELATGRYSDPPERSSLSRPGSGTGGAGPIGDDDSHHGRVVLADDSEIARKILRAAIQGGGQFRVIAEACNGMEAVEQTRALLPDVVVMDLAMPTLNGLEAARRILDEVPTPILLVSALESISEVDLQAEGLDPDSVAVLPKPPMVGTGSGEDHPKALREVLRRLVASPVRRRRENDRRFKTVPPLLPVVEVARSGPRPEVLLIEDSAIQADALAAYLRDSGFEVRICWDASKGWAAAQQARPDLVICDVILPGGSGFDLCCALKASRATRDVPVVFLTAAGQPMQVVRALTAGASAFFAKPWDASILAPRLWQLLSRPVTALPGDEDVEVKLRGETVWVTSNPQLLLTFLVDAFEDSLRAQGQLEAGRLQLEVVPPRSLEIAPTKGEGSG